jgi:hypothetical protein
MDNSPFPCITWGRIFVSEVKACFIPLRGSPEAVNCEVRQQYRLLLKPREWV